MVYKCFYSLRYFLLKVIQKIYIFHKTLFINGKKKMVLRSQENFIGAWSFLIGVVLAIIIGLFTTLLPIPALIAYSTKIYSVLVILGIVVGLMIVKGSESRTFLIAGVTIILVGKLVIDSVTGPFLSVGLGDAVKSISSALMALFMPATIIVALKMVFSIAKV